MTEEFRHKVMSVIEERGVSMRPRWHFLLLSALTAAGALILIITLLYIVSLALFFLRETGVWYATSFGGRGWFVLLNSAPIMLVVLVAIFAVILDVLVRKYSFAYRAPLTVSLGGILLVIFLGGLLVAQTSLHRRLEAAAHHGHLPPPIGFWYGETFRPHPTKEMHRGLIIFKGTKQFVMVDSDGSTSTIQINSKTRLPRGEDFEMGDMVIVIGDSVGTDTIRAFGVRSIDVERIEE